MLFSAANHAAEIQRLAKIDQVCAKYPELHAQAVADGWSTDRAEHEVLKASIAKGPSIHVRTGQRPANDVLEAAFCRSAGLNNLEAAYRPEVLEAADRTFRGGIGIQEMLMQAAAANGYHDRLSLRGGNLRDVLEAAFLRASSGTSTYSLPGILSNVANKFLLDGFMSVEQTWREIAKVTPVNDFKTATRYRLNDSLEYVELPPSATMTHGTLSEETYSIIAKTYARMLGVTRTDIINDDLGSFDTIKQRLGRGAGLKLNNVFWPAFLDNAAFFTAARGNLKTGTVSALGEDGVSLAAAEVAFAEMRDALDHPLGVQPNRVLVPTALGVTARKIFVSAELRDGGSDVYLTSNINQGRFKPSVSSYIGSSATNGSDTAWYLLADPAILATMEVAFWTASNRPPSKAPRPTSTPWESSSAVTTTSAWHRRSGVVE